MGPGNRSPTQLTRPILSPRRLSRLAARVCRARRAASYGCRRHGSRQQPRGRRCRTLIRQPSSKPSESWSMPKRRWRMTRSSAKRFLPSAGALCRNTMKSETLGQRRHSLRPYSRQGVGEQIGGKASRSNIAIRQLSGDLLYHQLVHDATSEGNAIEIAFQDYRMDKVIKVELLRRPRGHRQG